MDLFDLEFEFDMRVDVFDLDLDFDEDEKFYKRCVVCKIQFGIWVFFGGRKQVFVGQKLSIDLLYFEFLSELGLVESGCIILFSGVIIFVEVKEEFKLGYCCLCFLWLGCKIKKCVCKVVGGFCGFVCGCKVG